MRGGECKGKSLVSILSFLQFSSSLKSDGLVCSLGGFFLSIRSDPAPSSGSVYGACLRTLGKKKEEARSKAARTVSVYRGQKKWLDRLVGWLGGQFSVLGGDTRRKENWLDDAFRRAELLGRF